MIKGLKEIVSQQLVISKLKKEAKIMRRITPQSSLMECQNIIAQKHGFKHWHELNKIVKNRLLKFEGDDEFYLGNKVLPQYAHIKNNFQSLHIEKSKYSKELSLSLFEGIIEKENSQFIYCRTNEDDIYTDIKKYSESNNVKFYELTFMSGTGVTNNINLSLAGLSSGSLAELFFSLIIYDEDANSESWKHLAISLISSLMMALVYMRDNDEIKLTFNDVEHYILYDNFLKLLNRSDFPKHIKDGLMYYQKALRDGDVGNLDEISVLEKHGYLQMQYMKVLMLLSNCYGYLFGEKYPFNFNDIMDSKDKYILVVHFPNFEVSLSEMERIFHTFFFLWKNSLSNYVFDKQRIKYSTYIFFESPPRINLNMPVKLLNIPVNFIIHDKKKHDVLVEIGGKCFIV